MEQRTNEWYRARLGKFNASEVGQLMVAGRGKGAMFGKGAITYMERVAQGRDLWRKLQDDEVMDDYLYLTQITTAAMRRGIEAEPKHRLGYSIATGHEVTEAGSIQHPYFATLAASPDGLVGEDGMIEIKDMGVDNYYHYRFSVNDAATLKDTEPRYYWQVMANLACNGRAWCDFIVGCSILDDIGVDAPLHIFRIERDEDAIAQLMERVAAAEKEVCGLCERLAKATNN